MRKHYSIFLNLLFLIIGILIINAGCASTLKGKNGKSSNPDQVITAYYKNIYLGNIEAGYSMLSSNLRSQFSLQQYSTSPKIRKFRKHEKPTKGHDFLNERGTKILLNMFWEKFQIKILKVDIKGDRASVTFEIWGPNWHSTSEEGVKSLEKFIALDKEEGDETEMINAATKFWNSMTVSKSSKAREVGLIKEGGEWKINDGWDNIIN